MDIPIAPGGGSRGGLMGTLEYYFVTKAPFQLPASVKEFIVKFGPWIDLLFLLISLPLVLAVIGLSAAFSVFAPVTIFSWSIHSVLSLLVFAMSFIALPGLFRRKISGWNMVFYATVISALASFSYGHNIVGGVVSLIISLYFLFQVRSYYN